MSNPRPPTPAEQNFAIVLVLFAVVGLGGILLSMLIRGLADIRDGPPLGESAVGLACVGVVMVAAIIVAVIVLSLVIDAIPMVYRWFRWALTTPAAEKPDPDFDEEFS